MRVTVIRLMIGLLTIISITFFACNTVNPPTPIIEVPRDEAPAWSPDGKYIAYNHYNPEPDEDESIYSLRLLDMETLESSLILDGFAFNPNWSPDGQWLAFNGGDIFKIRPDGTDLQQITNVGSAFFPSWSPDGKTISYSRSGSQEEVGIWYINLEDSISTKFGFGSAPADWAPSGQQIVYEFLNEENSEGDNQIWTADTSGANKAQLTTNEFSANRAPAGALMENGLSGQHWVIKEV
tara:strand:- start:4457 stop:5170 length:714 start_codon:yes stop_codon:yes gene_type:complete